MRWYSMKFAEIDEMLLTDVWDLDAFTALHPPADMLLAAFLGYKSSGKNPRNMREAAKANSQAMREMPMLTRGSKTLNQMPAFLRGPEKMAMIAKMKAAMERDTDA